MAHPLTRRSIFPEPPKPSRKGTCHANPLFPVRIALPSDRPRLPHGRTCPRGRHAAPVPRLCLGMYRHPHGIRDGSLWRNKIPIFVSILDVETRKCPENPAALDEAVRVMRRERRTPPSLTTKPWTASASCSALYWNWTRRYSSPRALTQSHFYTPVSSVILRAASELAANLCRTCRP